VLEEVEEDASEQQSVYTFFDLKTLQHNVDLIGSTMYGLSRFPEGGLSEKNVENGANLNP
jgi:hypothetical protein